MGTTTLSTIQIAKNAIARQPPLLVSLMKI